MDLFEVVDKRRSIRRFKNEPVSTEHLRMILEAARLAPSGGNRQPWYFIVVKDQEMKKALATSSQPSNQKIMLGADMIVALVSDPELEKAYHTSSICSTRSWYQQDPMLAGEHIVLAATALGYGTCWMAGFNDAEAKKILKIPEGLAAIALIAIGIPDETPRPRSLKAFKEMFFKDSYGTPLEL